MRRGAGGNHIHEEEQGEPPRRLRGEEEFPRKKPGRFHDKSHLTTAKNIGILVYFPS